ncbi:hypothetical protein HY091_01415 [Candidatus Kaiserbacteria bacterium]|nr:hypothetical protein [Candidatus Kaiserbacteria bacterium]
MNIRALVLGAFVACSLLVTPAFAADTASSGNNTTVTIDLTKLDDVTRNAVIAAIKADQAVAQPVVSANTARQWADVGQNIGNAIAETCKALSIGVNDFIKTPAGILTIAMLFFYLFGGSLWAVVGGSLVWVVLGSVIWKSFSIFHRPQKLMDKDGKQHFEIYEFHSNDARVVSVVAHVASFIVLSVIMIVIIL